MNNNAFQIHIYINLQFVQNCDGLPFEFGFSQGFFLVLSQEVFFFLNLLIGIKI